MFSAGEWTWMGGSNLVNKNGVYGTRGTAASGNIPGARQYALSWTDTAGNFLLFGGSGVGPPGASGAGDAPWEYDGAPWGWGGVGRSAGAPRASGIAGKAPPAN